MCAGEYVATKSQNELTKGEIATERRHIRDHLKDELMEVSSLLELIGIGEEHRSLQKDLVRHYARDHEALLKINVALELGFIEEEERSPIMAGMVSFLLFLVGAFPSVFPFMIPDIDPNVGFIVAGVITCISLLIVGAVKTWATKGNCLSSGLENLCVAGFGGAVAYGAGALTAVFIDQE
jgi:vacuolar iron transporter family protein